MPTVLNFNPTTAKAGDPLDLYHKRIGEVFTGYVTTVTKEHSTPWKVTPSEDPSIPAGRIEYRLPIETTAKATIRILIFELPDDMADADLTDFAQLSADLRGVPYDGVLDAGA